MVVTADAEQEIAPERLARIRGGDPAAWDELYREHEAALYGWIFHRANKDRALADDVFHDAFLRAVERIAQWDPARGTFAAWVCGIARNELRQRQRAAARPLPPAPTTEAPRDPKADLHRAVNLALSSLSPRHQRVLVLKYQEGRSLEEIAALLATTPAAVGSLLHRARAAFREVYPREDEA